MSDIRRERDLSETLANLKASYAEPEKRFLCSSIQIIPAGTRFIKAFGFYEEHEDIYGCAVAPISVWRMKLTPNCPEQAKELGMLVYYATCRLAKREPEFLAPEARSLHERVYKRPKISRRFLNKQPVDVPENIYGVWSYENGGEVDTHIPLILSDLVQLYEELGGVIKPNRQIAQAFDYARWMEMRAPVQEPDYTQDANHPDYSYQAVDSVDTLSVLEGVEESELVQTALMRVQAMSAAGLPQEEVVRLVLGIARGTLTAELPDHSGRYRALTDRAHTVDGKNVSDMAKHRAIEMLSMLTDGHKGNTLADKLKAASDTNRSIIQEVVEQRDAQRKERIDSLQSQASERTRAEYLAKVAATNPSRSLQESFERSRRDFYNALNRRKILSDIIAGFEDPGADRSDESYRALVSGTGLSSDTCGEIPYFLPNTYTREDVYGTVYIYRSRPPGFMWEPLLELPENLKPFVERRSGQAPDPKQLLLAP